MNDSTEDSTTRVCKKSCCDRCSYITVKKYNLMRHLKRAHSPEERHPQEESHYTRKEFEEIMIRLTNSVRSPLKEQYASKDVEAIRFEPEKTETKIREGYFRALDILTRWINPDSKRMNINDWTLTFRKHTVWIVVFESVVEIIKIFKNEISLLFVFWDFILFSLITSWVDKNNSYSINVCRQQE